MASQGLRLPSALVRRGGTPLILLEAVALQPQAAHVAISVARLTMQAERREAGSRDADRMHLSQVGYEEVGRRLAPPCPRPSDECLSRHTREHLW